MKLDDDLNINDVLTDWQGVVIDGKVKVEKFVGKFFGQF